MSNGKRTIRILESANSEREELVFFRAIKWLQRMIRRWFGQSSTNTPPI